ncbi:hypothetical protein AB0K16_45680 [Nonomuraea jabiensis]
MTDARQCAAEQHAADVRDADPAAWMRAGVGRTSLTCADAGP